MNAYYAEDQWINWVDVLAEHDYVVMDDFLPQELYTQIREFFAAREAEEAFAKAGIGAGDQHTVISSIRGDFTFWLEPTRDAELTNWWGLLDEAVGMLNRLCYLSLSGYEFHLAHYPQGSFYKKHVDQFSERSNRMISMVIYLNENWQPGDGGELEIHRPDGSTVLVEPLARRCAMFKSATVPHAVLPTHAAHGRDSLTGWLLYYPAAVTPILA